MDAALDDWMYHSDGIIDGIKVLTQSMKPMHFAFLGPFSLI